MLDYEVFRDIADAVYDSLGIPDDMAQQLNKDTIRKFWKQYNDDYIQSLIDAELSKYDTSDNNPSDIQDIKDNALDEVMDRISMIEDNYYRGQEAIVDGAFAELVNVLENANFTNIVSVSYENSPADPSVGIFDDERYINLELANGSYITLIPEFED